MNFYTLYFIIRCCIHINAFRNLNHTIRFLIPQFEIEGIYLNIIMHSHGFLPFFNG